MEIANQYKKFIHKSGYDVFIRWNIMKINTNFRLQQGTEIVLPIQT